MRKLASLFLLLISLAGCAHPNAPSPERVEQKKEQFEALSRSKIVQKVPTAYVAARAVPLQDDKDPLLGTRVTLRQRGSLAELCASISRLTPLTVQVTAGGSEGAATLPALPDPGAPLQLPATPSSSVLSVSYDGTLRGLLDHLAVISGYGWDYSASAVTFSLFQVKTYTLEAAPGTVAYGNTLTTKSRETRSGSLSSGSNINQTVSSASTSSQNAQTNQVNLRTDAWNEAVNGVKALLSPKGTVTGNQVAGTITVRDTASHVRQITAYMDDVNARSRRQVALQVQVWALQLSDEAEASIDLQAIFTTDNIAATAGSLASTGGIGSASVTILNGKLKNSEGVLKALKQWGTTTVVTTGGGVAMNNQPLPILDTRRDGYLAAVSSTTSNDYGRTSELTPGEETTGFSMTVVPHILDQRRVILQYNINLSNLDALKEFSTADATIQLPQVSSRAFQQRTAMKMGQTLVLAGYQQESQSTDNGAGLFSAGRKSGYGKTLLIIAIEVESAEV